MTTDIQTESGEITIKKDNLATAKIWQNSNGKFYIALCYQGQREQNNVGPFPDIVQAQTAKKEILS